MDFKDGFCDAHYSWTRLENKMQSCVMPSLPILIFLKNCHAQTPFFASKLSIC